MSIGAIGPIGGWEATAAATPIGPSAGVDRTDAAESVAGSGFGDMLSRSIAAVDEAQSKSSDLAIKAATGDLTDVHEYMIASTQASVMTELTVAVRNKAVDAFNDIMRMPV